MIQVDDVFSALEMGLVKIIKSALDLDFANAIKAGSYGNSYQLTIENLNSGLMNKEIGLSEDFSNITFRSINGDLKELRLQDLTLDELDHLGGFVEKYSPAANPIAQPVLGKIMHLSVEDVRRNQEVQYVLAIATPILASLIQSDTAIWLSQADADPTPPSDLVEIAMDYVKPLIERACKDVDSRGTVQ